MNEWIKKAMIRKVYNHLDRTAFIVRTWNLDEDNDFITYFARKLDE
tara:strand:+ start:844 stop:981 length:138 start_codon:yes stop_codon:yes gene_type:complete